MKILIVDDNREDRDLIITSIKNSGKETIIDESNCLNDALSKIDLNSYDAIILDLTLPESDGIETVRNVKQRCDEVDKHIPIIVLTGLEDYKVGREAWSLGVKDFLIKDELGGKDLSRALSFATCGNGK